MAAFNAANSTAFFKVSALYDRDVRRIHALKRCPAGLQLGIDSAEELTSPEALQNTDARAVVVAVHGPEREPAISTMLRRERFVIVEAPLVADPAVASRLAQAIRQWPEAQQHLLVGEAGACWPGLRVAQEHLGRGAVGEVLGGESQAIFPGGPECSEVNSAGLNALLFPGLRCVRALQRVLGPVEEVSCMLRANAGGATSSGSANPFAKSPNPRNPFAKAEPASHVQPAGSTTELATCMLRHRGGAVSSLRARLGGNLLPGPHLVVNAAAGDVILDETQLLVAGQRTDISGGGEEAMYAEFAEQLKAAVAGKPWAGLASTLDPHLSDMAVAAACQASVRSRRCEAVREL